MTSASEHKAGLARPFLTAVTVACLPHAPFAQDAEEPVCLVSVLDNGDFSQAPAEGIPTGHEIPWWTVTHGRPRVEDDEGGRVLVTVGGAAVQQPLFAFAPYLDRMRVRGRMSGQGTMLIADGRGAVASETFFGNPRNPRTIDFRIANVRTTLPELTPRLLISLSGDQDGAIDATARWMEMEVVAELPCPSETALRTELTGLFGELVDLLESGESAPVPRDLTRILLRASALGVAPAWGEAALRGGVRGLPAAARRDLDALRLLVEVALAGPVELARELRGAARLAATSFDADVLSPADRLGLGCAQAELAAATGGALRDVFSREAAIHAELARRELVWTGDSTALTPGFTEDFAGCALDALRIWRARPSSPLRALVLSGYEYYAAPWDNAVRHGFHLPADAVCAWKVLVELARMEPRLAEPIGASLARAARAHLKGQQVQGGAWVDAASLSFNPRQADLADGGRPPTLLLRGLAWSYDDAVGLRADETRAMYTAVLRATVEAFGVDGGVSARRLPPKGGTPAPDREATIAFAWALIEMLERLHE